MANVPSMGGATAPAAALPMAMSQQDFEDHEDPRCFVLVDGQAVGMVPGNSEVQHLLSEQQAELEGVGEAEKDDIVLQVGGDDDDSVMEAEHFEEALGGMKEGKMEVTGTVEVVHVEGGKTLEVMHIDTGKPLQVIHIEGGGKLDFTGGYRGGNVKVVVPPTSPSLPYGSREVTAAGSPQRVRHVVNTPQSRRHASSSLRSLGPPATQPIIVSTRKDEIVPGHPYCRLPSGDVFPAMDKSQNIASHNIDSNILITGNKEVLRGAGVALDNAIIISWPSIAQQELENTVGTQTEPCNALGPSLNLFYCTFHANSSVETYCDFPMQCNKSTSTDNRARCRDRMKLGGPHPGSEEEEKESVLLTMEEGAEEDELRERGTYQRFSRSGRILKGKGPVFRAEVGASEEDLRADPDFELLEEEEAGEATPQSIPHRRKRGRKRKRRPPSPDLFEEELKLAAEEEEEKEKQQMQEVKVKKEVKEEEMEEEAKVESEMALEVMRKKGYGLRTKRRLKKLTDMHYLQDHVVRRQQPDHNRLFPCRVCGCSFPTFFKLQRHAKEEHNFTNFSFPCEVCDMVFTRPHNLERHKETKHGTGQKRHICEHCGRRFSRPDVLSVHVSMVHLRRAGVQKGSPTRAGTHHCTGCNNFFSREQRLREHREGDFTCKECSITFECRTALRLHCYKSHPTACSECGKICNNKQQMYFHKQTHAPKFVCKLCNKGFLWRPHYTVHMATHTGDRSVPCDVCGKTFAHKVAVSKHKWQEHNENNKKFKCEQCGKCFVYRGKLASHMRSHTGEKPYTCHACPSTFSQRSNLNAHVKSVHGVVVKSVKSDGTTHTELVKYKRPKKAPATPSAPPPPHHSTDEGSAGLPQEVELPPAPPQPPHIDIQEQVHMSESSLETEAAVYQIVYAYPQ